MSRTAAGQMMLNRGRFTKEFQVYPESLDFGAIPTGGSREMKLTLKNISGEASRFVVSRIDNPHFRVRYQPGLIAAGLDTTLFVQFAPQGGLQPGTITNASIEIRTETAIFRVPVVGSILVITKAKKVQAGFRAYMKMASLHTVLKSR